MIFAPGSKLEKISPKGFCRTGLEKIVIPKSLTEIRESAFEGCESLREVVFEEGSRLETIGARCFSGCGLEEITLPASVRFYFSSNGIEEVSLPSTLRKIYEKVFENCKQLKKV